MAKPKDHKTPASGKRVTGSKAGERRTSKTAGHYAQQSAKSSRFTGNTDRLSSTNRSGPRSASSGKAADQLAPGGFGCAEGLIWIAPDFEEPLEEFEADS